MIKTFQALKMRKSTLLTALGLCLMMSGGFTLSSTAEPSAVDPDLQKIISGDHRSEKYKNRNKYRHPAETLDFLGLEKTMTVVELWPGGGWYTEILAPYLKQSGIYYAADRQANPDSAYVTRSKAAYLKKIESRPDLYDKVTITEIGSDKSVIAPKGSADMVLTFRNWHNWMRTGFETTVMKASFEALKPGGILGIIEHRENPDADQDPRAKSGYVKQALVIKIAESAGFKLIESSEINANAKDSRNHPEGVWTLPPSLRLKDKDRAKYLAIGESDRMTLKFIKPKK